MHIAGPANSAYFIVATFGGVAEEKLNSFLSIGLKGFGRYNEFLLKHFVNLLQFLFKNAYQII